MKKTIFLLAAVLSFYATFAQKYEKKGGYSDGMAAVYYQERWGFVDGNDKLVINYAFEEVKPFSNGVAKVKYDGRWIYIDKSGKVVSAPQRTTSSTAASSISASTSSAQTQRRSTSNTSVAQNTSRASQSGTNNSTANASNKRKATNSSQTTSKSSSSNSGTTQSSVPQWMIDAAEGNIEAQYKLVTIYIEMEQYKNAFLVCQKAKKSGDRGASWGKMCLIYCYMLMSPEEYGLKIDSDNRYDERYLALTLAEIVEQTCTDMDVRRKASIYRKDAAEQYEREAYIYYNDRQYRTAFEDYELAYKACPNHRVEYMLWQCYEEGIGVNKDYGKALFYFKRAAERGYAPAQNVVGVFYYKGMGCEKDIDEAISWIRKAASQGDNSAQENLRTLELERQRNTRNNQNNNVASNDNEKLIVGGLVAGLVGLVAAALSSESGSSSSSNKTSSVTNTDSQNFRVGDWVKAEAEFEWSLGGFLNAGKAIWGQVEKVDGNQIYVHVTESTDDRFRKGERYWFYKGNFKKYK